MWHIEYISTKELIEGRQFETKEAAQAYLNLMPPSLRAHHRLAFEGANPLLNRMLTEGLLKNDLEGILLPRMSVDEYVPSDPDTDNVVLAFFVKGVPEAVVPFKDFCDKCAGVLDVDYGDSDTIPNTSIVYAEMDRENLDINDINELIEQIGMLANLTSADFTMTFPHTTKKFPYDTVILQRYFQSRNDQKNMMAQKQAIEQKHKDNQEMIQKLQQNRQQNPEQEAQNESLANKLVSVLLG